MSAFMEEHRPCPSVTWVQSGAGEPDVGKFHPHYCNGDEGHAGTHGCDCGVEWRTPFLPPKRPIWGKKEMHSMMQDLVGAEYGRGVPAPIKGRDED